MNISVIHSPFKNVESNPYQQSDTLNNMSASSLATTIPKTINVAIFATDTVFEQAIEDVCFYIENNLSDIIQLPELFFIDDKTKLMDDSFRYEIEQLSELAINNISAKVRPHQYVATSLVINDQHQAVLISSYGIAALQPQLSNCSRYPWTVLGESLKVIELPLEFGVINVAMLTADDVLTPDVIEAAAKNEVHALLVAFDIQTANTVESLLYEHSNALRICCVAATREKSFPQVSKDTPCQPVQQNVNNTHKVKSIKSTGFIINLPSVSVQQSREKSRKFTGDNKQPLITHQHGKITKALFHPMAK